MNNEDIEDGVFEEIPEREVLSTKDLSPELADKLIKDIEAAGSNELSPEDAASFAAEIEAAQKDMNVIKAPEEQRPLTQGEMIAAVKNAVKEGVLSKGRKQRMMQEMGIFKSAFTKKATSKPAAAKKRKAAKKARRKNRK